MGLLVLSSENIFQQAHIQKLPSKKNPLSCTLNNKRIYSYGSVSNFKGKHFHQANCKKVIALQKQNMFLNIKINA